MISYRIPTYPDDLQSVETNPSTIAVRRFTGYNPASGPSQMYQLIQKYTDFNGDEQTKVISGMSATFADHIKNCAGLDAMQRMLVDAHRGGPHR